MSTKANLHHNPAMGITFILLSTVFFTIADALGKWLAASYPIIQLAWIRCILGVLLIGLYAVTTGRVQQLKTTRPGWHLFRGVLSIGMILGVFFGLKNLALAEFVSILFSMSFFIAILSPWLLHERVTTHSWYVIAVGFIGVLFVLRPTPEHFHFAHRTTRLTAATGAILVITARRLAITESALALNIYLYPFTIVLICYWAIAYWVTPSTLDWLLFIALGITATAAVGCFIQAMRFARPAVVAPMDYVRMIWIILIGYVIWQEIPDPVTWIGIIIIMISGIYLVRHSKIVPEVGVNVIPVEDDE